MSDDLKDMRENYKKGSIDVDTLLNNPFQQFLQWFDEAKVSSVPEANAMILSTATSDGVPSSRTVLLKGIDEGFVFYFFGDIGFERGFGLGVHGVCWFITHQHAGLDEHGAGECYGLSLPT